MSTDQTYAIVGAGQAGGWAAKTIRDSGFDGRIVLIGEEEYLPYERPPLSKQLLLGEQEVEKSQILGQDKYDDAAVELKLGTRVESLSPANHTLTLADGETLAYERLLLTMGGRPRTLDIPGANLTGVHTLRTIPDCLAIREAINGGAKVAVIGGGWIGLEVAAASRKLGAEACVIEVADRLLGRTVAPDISAFFLDLHHEHGVDVRLNATVERLEGGGKVERVALAAGTTIEATLVVIGVGLIPNVELAAAAGLEIDNGVVVDEFGRTSDPDIFAAGDVTNHPNSLLGRRVRLESWDNAMLQGVATAKSMADKGAEYAPMPWFWSDQFDINCQLVGLPESWDEAVTRGDMATKEFIIFYLKDKRIVGAAGVNAFRDFMFTRRIAQMGKEVDGAQLADPEVKLQELMKP